MKKTKIVCTLGPASWDKEVFKELVFEGLNVARLNFSHGDHETHRRSIEMVKSVRTEMGMPLAIMLDTKGPEIRTGTFKTEVVELITGETYTLTTRDVEGDENICSISYKDLPSDVGVGGKILIDDGLVELEVVEIKDGTDIVCKVLNDGQVKNYKGVNVPGAKLRLPALTEKDISDIEFGIENGVDFIAASFIRTANDVLSIRKILEDNGADKIQIISKIENAEGVENIDEIIRVSDGIMVARGDLGVEIPMERIPIVQKDIIRKCNLAQKPVITATQMLDSMIRNPRPTRAESTDIANAIFDGTDAIMLSGETASGDYPVQAVQMMASIALETEKALDYDWMFAIRADHLAVDVTFALSHATVTTSKDLDARAIITATSSGFTARKLSSLRPRATIVAACTKNYVRRQLSLMWGVETIDIQSHDTIEQIFEHALSEAKKEEYVKTGDIIVFTAGVPVGVAGATNLMRVHLVGEMLIKAVGIGNKVVSGNIKFVRDIKDANSIIEDGDIMVCEFTDKSAIEAIERCAALIVVEGGLTSHAAIVALNLGVPTVVGARDAFEVLSDNQMVTIDSEKGIVYAGRTRVL